MKNSSEIRSDARAALSGNWGVSALFFFVYLIVAVVITLAAEQIPIVGSLLGTLVQLPILYGVYVGLLRQVRGQELQIEWLFKHFNMRVWGTMILQNIYTMLWTLLLIIPGIVKVYSYSMTSFILEDEPELEYDEAIEQSMEMMSGNKWRLFVLDLTFIGWYLLCIPTLGIGFLWVAPYHYSARAAFYEDLKNQE